MRPIFILAALAACTFAAAKPIQLQVATFDPQVRTPSFKTSLMYADFQETGLFLVQSSGFVSDELRQRLTTSGAAVLDYYPQDTLLVRGNRSALLTITGVAWVVPFHPAFRIDPMLGKTDVKGARLLANRRKGLFKVSIVLTKDAEIDLARAMLDTIGVVVTSQGMMGDQAVLSANVTREQIENLARNETVQFIEDAGEVTLRNTTSRWIVQTNVTDSTPLYTAGVNGAGQIMGIIDGLIYTAHTSFSDTNPIGPTHRKIVYAGSTASVNSHGTHVAGTAAGDAGVFDERRGVAWGAKFAFSAIPDTTETMLYNLLVTHHNVGARDHTNSWGDDSTTAYTARCRAIDRFSWDYEDDMVAFAITNLTSQVRTPENAKSALAVSATRNSPNQNTNASFGGLGPTSDLRRKPEVHAPGDSIPSAGTSSTTAIATMGGTSMACPAATASGTLIRQFLREGRIYDGNPNANFVINPSGALLRAMLMTSAVDMTGVAGYPSDREGFGRILIDNVLALPGDTRKTIVRDVRNASGLATSQNATYQFKVTSNTQPLRVTMTFTDFPAAVGASNSPVNNINLSVAGPSGTFLGNVFVSGQSTTGGTSDAVNSTEMVMRDIPTLGLYTVTINGANVPSGPQGYALVINGAVVGSEITGTLSLGHWVGTYPSSVPVTFLNAGGTPYAGGTVNATVNPTTHQFTVAAPPSVTGSYRLRFNFGAHLLKTYPSMSSAAETSMFPTWGTISLINGDPDRSGEVDPIDIDLVTANFGAQGVLPTQGDLNFSGEVDPVDIDIVIANFGAQNN